MEKINVVGNIWGTSGYAIHTRQLVNALAKKSEVCLLCQKIPEWERMCNDEELLMLKRNYSANQTMLAITMPQQWQPLLSEPNKIFLGYCVWEGTKIPTYWLDIFNNDKLNFVLVPSTHTKQAILNTIANLSIVKAAKYIGVVGKIIVIPHGVDKKLFYPKQPSADKKVFTFVSNGGWAQGINDRKGLQFLLKAFNEEFKNEEEVELVVKINTAYCPPGWDLSQEIAKLGLDNKGGKIKINTDLFDFDRIVDFYSMGDVYVSPTMGEAFGMPMAEAMACGLPVITTNFGGQTDYVNAKNGWLIDFEFVENTWDNMYEGIGWAKPDKEHLKKLLREAFTNQELVKEKGKQALIDIEKFSWDASAEQVLELIYKGTGI